MAQLFALFAVFLHYMFCKYMFMYKCNVGEFWAIFVYLYNDILCMEKINDISNSKALGFLLDQIH